jgi:hypothetical protein
MFLFLKQIQYSLAMNCYLNKHINEINCRPMKLHCSLLKCELWEVSPMNPAWPVAFLLHPLRLGLGICPQLQAMADLRIDGNGHACNPNRPRYFFYSQITVIIKVSVRYSEGPLFRRSLNLLAFTRTAGNTQCSGSVPSFNTRGRWGSDEISRRAPTPFVPWLPLANRELTMSISNIPS